MAKHRQLSKAQYENLAAFRYALRLFLRFSEDAARQAGIAPQQHQALLAIRGFPGRDIISIGELAERLQLRHHSAVELVNRMADCNLIVREPSEIDRRQVNLKLTPQGEDVLDKLSFAHEEQLRGIGPHLRELLSQLQ